MFIAGALAFPGYWFWDVLVFITAVMLAVLIGVVVLRVMFPRPLRRWLRGPAQPQVEAIQKPGPPPQARFSDRR